MTADWQQPLGAVIRAESRATQAPAKSSNSVFLIEAWTEADYVEAVKRQRSIIQ